MRFKYITIACYMLVLFGCVFTFPYEININSEYQKSMEKIEYQLSKPTLYALDLENTLPVEETTDETVTKKAYLTFDDGPTPRTGEILDILKENEVKATFFVIKPEDREYDQYLLRAAQEGHAIGVHTASHKYKEIYQSVQSYVDDFEVCYNYINELTGLKPTIFRFPGGSVNSYNKNVYKNIIEEMTRRNFVYFDWNIESKDSTGNLSADNIYNNVINSVDDKQRVIIIMHDANTRKNTVAALDGIIKSLKEKGYEFDVLSQDVKPIQFKIK